jgi:hypothetical protein
MLETFKPVVECSRAHELITRLVVQLTRGIARKYFPKRPLYHQAELGMLMLFVVIGHVERHPVTVSKIARAIGLSRTTTLRWLKELVASGYVERTPDGHYWLTDKTTTPDVDRLVGKNASLIIETAKELQATQALK